MIEKLAEQPTVFDTDQQQLGGVYAKALLEYGRQIGKLDLLVEQLDAVTVAIGEVPGFSAVLGSPRVPVEARGAMLEKAFAGKVDPVLMNFLKVVNAKSRCDCLPAINASAKEIQDEIAGRVRAVLTSATEMDQASLDRIAGRLSEITGKTVAVRSLVDPKIIGGITVRIGDTVYDASLLNQLSQMRQRAVQRAADAIREKLDRFVVN